VTERSEVPRRAGLTAGGVTQREQPADNGRLARSLAAEPKRGDLQG